MAGSWGVSLVHMLFVRPDWIDGVKHHELFLIYLDVTQTKEHFGTMSHCVCTIFAGLGKQRRGEMMDPTGRGYRD